MQLSFIAKNCILLHFEIDNLKGDLKEKLCSIFKPIKTINKLGLDDFYKVNDLQKAFNVILEKYKKDNPTINSINSFLSKLNSHEHILIYELNLNFFDIVGLRVVIGIQNLNPKCGVIAFSEFMKNKDCENRPYNILYLGSIDQKVCYVGEKDKTKRECRFCHKKNGEVTFKEKAHAISESLGNKLLFCYEECDDCNRKFGKEIEEIFIRYIDPSRAIYLDNKTWKGYIKILGTNFGIAISKENGYPKFALQKCTNKLPIGIYNAYLNGTKSVILQDVYRCLCKYVIDLLPSKYLKYFKNTILWINGDLKLDAAYNVYRIISKVVYNNQPYIFCHIRKKRENDKPYCFCEFHCIDRILFYIIPFASDGIQENFIEVSKFWESIFNKIECKTLENEDFSSDIPQVIITTLKVDATKIITDLGN